MQLTLQKNWFLIVLTFLCFSKNVVASVTSEEAHMKVSMRMIGHEILNNFGNSVSRILPIKKEGEAYRIEFAAQFRFNPNELVETINGVAVKAKLSNRYLVEVVSCEEGDVVYSYEVGSEQSSDIIPCGNRPIEMGCYSILFTPMVGDFLPQELKGGAKDLSTESKPKRSFGMAYLLIPLVLFLGWGFYSRRKKIEPEDNSHVIELGRFSFDKTSMKLLIDEEKIELTSKEADLLSLLHESLNITLKRETILEKVWGDEGDYVGRTLDVFISKLRKKLEADPNVKIVNIRGVGYRLILEK